MKLSEGKSEKKDIYQYSYSGVINESITKGTAGKIIKWFIEKNIDLRASLRLGM